MVILPPSWFMIGAILFSRSVLVKVPWGTAVS
jgi:hypothetical protein